MATLAHMKCKRSHASGKAVQHRKHFCTLTETLLNSNFIEDNSALKPNILLVYVDCCMYFSLTDLLVGRAPR